MEKINEYDMTIIEAQKWLIDNQLIIFNNYRHTAQQLNELYLVYNVLTNENKKFTGCGRCIKNVIDRLRVETTKVKDKTLMHIYRNNFGYLTLKETTKIAYSFFLKDQNELIERLEYLKLTESKIKK